MLAGHLFRPGKWERDLLCWTNFSTKCMLKRPNLAETLLVLGRFDFFTFQPWHAISQNSRSSRCFRLQILTLSYKVSTLIDYLFFSSFLSRCLSRPGCDTVDRGATKFTFAWACSRPCWFSSPLTSPALWSTRCTSLTTTWRCPRWFGPGWPSVIRSSF